MVLVLCVKMTLGQKCSYLSIFNPSLIAEHINKKEICLTKCFTFTMCLLISEYLTKMLPFFKLLTVHDHGLVSLCNDKHRKYRISFGFKSLEPDVSFG